jgi:hypothetical protein
MWNTAVLTLYSWHSGAKACLRQDRCTLLLIPMRVCVCVCVCTYMYPVYLFIYLPAYQLTDSWHSVVVILAGCGLDHRGIVVYLQRWNVISMFSRLWDPPSRLYSEYRGWSGQAMKLIIHRTLIPRLRMRGARTPAPHMWSLRAQRQLNLYVSYMIVKWFPKCNQQDATFLNLFISIKCSTCFRPFLFPSSGAQIAHTASGICHTMLLPAAIMVVMELVPSQPW